MEKPIEQSGFILADGTFVNDWEAWKAEEIAIEKVDDLAVGLEYAERGRL